MKKLNIILSALILVAAIIVGSLFFINSKSGSISKEQKEIVSTLGNPEHFLITYLPREEGNFVRSEVWYYPSLSMKITFLEGRVFAAEDFEYEGEVYKTELVPWDFDINSSYDEVTSRLEGAVQSLEDLPGFYEKGLYESYISDEALFVMEGSYLTYLQTLGVSK